MTVLRAGVVADPYSGDVSPSWDSPVGVTVSNVLVEPRPSGEPVQDARNAVTSGFTLYMPASADVTAADRVEVRGRVYSVLGEPADWRLGSYRPGLVVQVERTEG